MNKKEIISSTALKTIRIEAAAINALEASVGQIFIRSLARLIIIDPFFIPFLGSTLHDHLSGTMVVES